MKQKILAQIILALFAYIGISFWIWSIEPSEPIINSFVAVGVVGVMCGVFIWAVVKAEIL